MHVREFAMSRAPASDEACVVCDQPSADLICGECRAFIAARPSGPGEVAAPATDGWWDELDDEILTILGSSGPMDPADLAMKLGMSTDAVCSCLSLLSTSGRIRILSVGANAPERAA
jgi:DprA/Smf-like nucleotide binding protein involved in DNA uptake